MKYLNHFLKIVTLSIVLLVMRAPAHAYSCQINGVYYTTLTNGTAIVTYGTTNSYTGGSYSGYVTIPSTITYEGTNYSVTSIGSRAFYKCPGLTGVSLPSTITTIGDYAFASCENLPRITIPAAVTNIYTSAFNECGNLNYITVNSGNTVYDSRNNCNAIIQTATNTLLLASNNTTIPNTVTKIASGAFYGRKGLIHITIPSSVTNIGYSSYRRVFDGCDNLTSIVVESGNTYYDSRDNCNAIILKTTNKLLAGCKNTIIPNTVTCIMAYAFDACKGLTQIEIPNSVTTIGYDAFRKCTDLISVSIPGTVTSIDGYTFYGCSNLTDVTLGYGITAISPCMFEGCESLTHITIPNSVTEIEWWAFNECSSLTGITIPSSVTFIGVAAFGRCPSMVSMKVQSGNTVYDSRNGCNAIIKTATNELIAGCHTSVIPATVNSIGSAAFVGCSSLTSITLPNSVTKIGEQAFLFCDGLTEVNMSDSITAIYDHAFCGCVNLRSIELPSSLRGLGFKALACGSTDTEVDNFISMPAVDMGDEEQHITDQSHKAGYKTLAKPSQANRDEMPGLQHITDQSHKAGYKTLAKPSQANRDEMPGLQHIYSRIEDPSLMPLYDGDYCVPFYEPSYSTCILHVPAGTVEAYRTADVWKNFEMIIDSDTLKVQEIILDKNTATMFQDDTLTINATVLPSFVENDGVMWSSSNTSIATVDQNGLVTAVGLGIANITATALDAPEVTATCIVNVVQLDTDNYFTMEDSEVLHGRTIVIPVSLNNTESITAFQTDLWLPEGFELVKQSGEYLVTLSNRADNDHVISANDADNSSVRVLCYSNQLKPFSGNEGILFYLTVQIPDDAVGDYDISLENTRFTTTNCEEILPAEANCNVHVKAYLEGDANNSGKVTITDVVTVARYVLNLNPQPFVFGAADMNGDGRITVTDAVLIAHLVLIDGSKAPHVESIIEKEATKTDE